MDNNLQKQIETNKNGQKQTEMERNGQKHFDKVSQVRQS